LEGKLDPGEQYVALRGYRGSVHARTPTGKDTEDQRLQKKARLRHEGINGMINRFSSVGTTSRHSIDVHEDIFMAVASIVQMIISIEGPPDLVRYNDVE